MKKILSVLLVFVLLSGLCACSQSGKENASDKYAQARTEVIQSLNVSLENKRIVGYKGENDHLIYIVVEYDENVRKISETTYYFCFNESVYDYMVPQFENEPGFTEFRDKIYFTFETDKASIGIYEKDVNKLKTEVTVK